MWRLEGRVLFNKPCKLRSARRKLKGVLMEWNDGLQPSPSASDAFNNHLAKCLDVQPDAAPFTTAVDTHSWTIVQHQAAPAAPPAAIAGAPIASSGGQAAAAARPLPPAGAGCAGSSTRVGVSSESMHGTRPRRLLRSCLRPLLRRGAAAVRTVRRSAPSPRLRRHPRGRPGRRRGAATAASASPRGRGQRRPRQRFDTCYIRRAVTVSRRRRRRLRRFGTPWDDGDAAGASPRWRGLRRRVGPYIRRAGSRRRHRLRRPGTSFRADPRPPPAAQRPPPPLAGPANGVGGGPRVATV